MLHLSKIRKTYKTGELIQTALDDVSLNLRDSEFVAVLGPSGSGKTTLLNIIGGLDRYDEGELVINGISTVKYSDRDWDTYRNHTIGFVFQSYNLIPHQNILANVELALTIAGISRKERRQRALAALEAVGLKEQAHKKPNQMSGGQMQRVAIARALVNDPDIVLADEPTGALDSKTSLQVMELLKEVARDRLVVMVTHNPELADRYASRIVQLKDGRIISDSNPYQMEGKISGRRMDRQRKAGMSFLTALSLSFNNLLTKKGRTILTAFAGSIGIIGIALILSLSQGFQNYIDKIQEDTLSSYPLTITSETADAASAILSMVSDRENNTSEGNEVRERPYLTTMFSSIGSNDLKTFKQYLENHRQEYDRDVSCIDYSYSVKPLIYTIDAAGKLARLNPSTIMTSMYTSSASSFMSSFSMGGNNIFTEMGDNEESYKDQYELLAGLWPENYDELLLVLSEPNSISDLLVYSLGLRDTAELKTILNNVMAGEEAGIHHESKTFTYDELLDTDLRLIRASDLYRYNGRYDVYEDMSNDSGYMDRIYEKALKLKITGIVCAKDRNSAMTLSTGVAYTKQLTAWLIDQAANTAIVQKQLKDKEKDVFSGERFDEENRKDETKIDFNDMISVDEDLLQDAFHLNVSAEDLNFDLPDEQQMQEIILKSAQDAADMIAQTPDATLLTGMLTGVNTALLRQEIETFEKQDGIVRDGKIYLKEKKIETFRKGIDAKTYKKFAAALLELDPSLNQYEDLLEVLDKKSYQTLADAVSGMFKSYYEEIRGSEEYDKEHDCIAYDASLADNVRYGSSLYETQLILSQLTGNEEALKLTSDLVNRLVNEYTVAMIAAQIGIATAQMMEPVAGSLTRLSDLFSDDLFTFDSSVFAKAFRFEMSEEELSRLMETMLGSTEEKSLKNNLISLGYQDMEEPSSIRFYFRDFEGKENFLAFLERYNQQAVDDSKIRYTDITGLLMSSVKTIVDVVTYVLIAFVSISLVVSSIMIAVITLISVMERTKEIGILRAMGASKRNVSSIFNAETFIIGLLSGSLGVGFTYAVLPLINALIHRFTNNYDVNAVLPPLAAAALVLIAVCLTILAGFIPSKKAARQDPVIALRTE